ncbi:MAG: hypothetical protein PHO32_07055 [Candidatus Cloacimonetes bacterium]|nr:hypothetical protein [Candidatus Cloacimonadota bacterium]
MKHGYIINREFHQELGLEKPGVVMKIRKLVTLFSDWTQTPAGDFIGCTVCYLVLAGGFFMIMLGW